MINNKQSTTNKILCYILITGIITLSFTSCSYLTQPTEEQTQHVVTSDDLTPSTTVEDIIATAETDGVNYDYFWAAGDIDAALAEMAMYGFTTETPEEEERLRSEFLENERRALEEEAKISYVVSAQEAANLAASVTTKALGINLDVQHYTDLQLMQNDNSQSFWSVYTSVEGGFHVNVYIDAITGQFIGIKLEILPDSHERLLERIETLEAQKVAECFVVTQEYDNGTIDGIWDETHESYDSTTAKLEEELTEALFEYNILQGASITSVEILHEFPEYPPQYGEINELLFTIELSDGRTLRAIRRRDTAPYINYYINDRVLSAYSLLFM